MSERSENHELLAVVSAIATELPRSALSDAAMFKRQARRLLPGVSKEDVTRAVAAPLRSRHLARQFCCADDPAKAIRAYTIACALVDESDSAARVFLNDLAEWLVMPPAIYRKLASSDWCDMQIAAA